MSGTVKQPHASRYDVEITDAVGNGAAVESENPSAYEAILSRNVRQLVAHLVTFNASGAAAEDRRPITVFCRKGRQIVGGAHGYTHWSWLLSAISGSMTLYEAKAWAEVENP